MSSYLRWPVACWGRNLSALSGPRSLGWHSRASSLYKLFHYHVSIRGPVLFQLHRSEFWTPGTWSPSLNERKVRLHSENLWRSKDVLVSKKRNGAWLWKDDWSSPRSFFQLECWWFTPCEEPYPSSEISSRRRLQCPSSELSRLFQKIPCQ